MKFYQYPRSTYRPKIHLSEQDDDTQETVNEEQGTFDWGGVFFIFVAILFALGLLIEFVS